jgi:hypothetical protein
MNEKEILKIISQSILLRNPLIVYMTLFTTNSLQ